MAPPLPHERTLSPPQRREIGHRPDAGARPASLERRAQAFAPLFVAGRQGRCRVIDRRQGQPGERGRQREILR